MSAKNETNKEVKAIKALLSSEDIAKAKDITRDQGTKLQAFYGHAIRKAIREASNGTRD